MDAYQKDFKDVIKNLDSSAKNGLSEKQVKENLEKFGPNNINLSSGFNYLESFIEQIKNPIVLLLIGTLIIAFAIGDELEAILIASIVIFMALIGVYIESKAGNAVEKLKELTSTNTTVLRNGEIQSVETSAIVPGDILVLQEGDRIPADARIIESIEAQVDESILTGESIPINKNNSKIDLESLIGDQYNMLFSGTYLVQGNVKAIVVSTGLKTELGKIAEKLSEEVSKSTPLQIQLDKLGKIILIGTLTLCSLILILGVIRGQDLVHTLIQTLSLAVAFIPEGLSAVMTVTLAVGVREMVHKQVLIKKLIAAEGLGSVSVMATDKTGTITEGKMSVQKIWLYDQEINSDRFKAHNVTEYLLLKIIHFCSNQKGATEKALSQFIKTLGIKFEHEERVYEHRFTSSIKRMSVIHKNGDLFNVYTKGAPDILIPLCTKYFDYATNSELELNEQKKEEILEKVSYYASNGYRVIATAVRNIHQIIEDRDSLENELTFVGLVIIIDPLRSDVKLTVNTLKLAGIRPIMITGDHPEIAKNIALQAGIATDTNDNVITGIELDHMKNDLSQFETKILNTNIFARVAPDHKNLLVELYQKNGLNISMAGDGINDAIAISKSDIGIAVANAVDIVKEASDVVITGSYNALANAVEVGRLIIFRTRLYLHYLLSGNLCQVGVSVLALTFNYPIPFSALSLLLINVLTDAAPALSMAFENTEKSILKEKPRSKSEGILNRYIWTSIFILGILSTIYLFAVFVVFYNQHGLQAAQTAVFTAYIFQKLFRAFTARSFKESVFSYGFFSNKFLFLSIIFSFLIWFVVIFFASNIFDMTTLELNDLLILLGTSLTIPIAEEILKFVNKKSNTD